jgi:hypothetical protein
MDKKTFLLVVLVGFIIALSAYVFYGHSKASYVEAALGDHLGIYKADGITFLGKLLSVPPGSVCENFVYYDNSGNVKKLSADDCNPTKDTSIITSIADSSARTVFFSSFDCTGQAYIATSSFSTLPINPDDNKYLLSLKTGQRDAYSVNKSASAVIAAYQSYITYNGVCITNNKSRLMYAVTKLYPVPNLGNFCGGTCKVVELP